MKLTGLLDGVYDATEDLRDALIMAEMNSANPARSLKHIEEAFRYLERVVAGLNELEANYE